MDTQKNYFYSMNTALLVPSFLCSWPLAIITRSLYSGAPLLVAYCSVYMIFTVLFHSSLVESKIHISTLEVIHINKPPKTILIMRVIICW
jgi:hypothetical protein